ncbi:MAG: hypothetical protein QOE54_846 [Streptosporangiaceae bacterium]|nr:hypothetical protein [Streptosporangiaceae bacterium]
MLGLSAQAVVTGLLVPAMVIWPHDRADAADGGDTVAFKISDPRISESSGLAASRRHPGVVYTHNDSGHGPQVYAVGPDGRTKATLTIAGARSRDWEGIALGRDETGAPALFIADIGDNLGGAWPYVTVYRVPEPAVLKDQALHAVAFRMKYQDGPRDAESILIDPRSNRLYIASKSRLFSGNGRLYAAPARLRTSGFNLLRKIADAPPTATDGAFAPDGRTFVLRTYFGATVYSAPGKRLADVSLPAQRQGESIAYTPDGRSLLAGSEGDDQPVWRVPVPAAALPSPTASPRTAGASTTRALPDRQPSTGKAVAFVVVVGLAVAGAVVIVRRRFR